MLLVRQQVETHVVDFPKAGGCDSLEKIEFEYLQIWWTSPQHQADGVDWTDACDAYKT